MARISYEQINKMSLNDIRNYTDVHPSDGFKAAKACAKTAGYCTEKAILNAVGSIGNAASQQQPSTATPSGGAK